MSIAAPRYEQITQRHGHAAALRGVELEVEHGAMVAVNGAGKAGLPPCLPDFCNVDGDALARTARPCR